MRSYKKWLLILFLCVMAVGVFGIALFFAQIRLKQNRLKVVEGEPQLVVQLGHSGGISSAVFSPDGRFIVSGGADPIGGRASDNAAILWETATGREIRRFVGHTSSINAIAFSPDGRYVLTGSGDGNTLDKNGNLIGCADCTARLWEVTSGKEVRRFVGHTGMIKSVAFSPDGRFVLTGSGNDPSINANGKLLGREHSIARLWDVATGKEIRRFAGHTEAVKSMVFSPDGRFALSDAGVLWDVATGEEIRRFGGQKLRITSVAFSSDGRFALTGSPESFYLTEDNVVTLWDVVTGKEVRRFKGCSPVAFSPDGSQILTGIATNKEQGAQLLKAETGEVIRYFTKKRYDPDSEPWLVESVAFSPNKEFALVVFGERLTGGNMGFTYGEVSLRLFDLASGKEAQRFESDSVGLADDLAFSPNGDLLLSGNGFWDLKSGREMRFKGYGFDESEYRRMAEPWVARREISRDGRYALTLKTNYGHIENEIVQLWDVATGREVFKVTDIPFVYVPSFWLSPDNLFIFIFGQVRHEGLKRFWAVSCWEVGARKEVWRFTFRRELWHHAVGQRSRANTDCAFSPDGKLFAIRQFSNPEEDKMYPDLDQKVYPPEWDQSTGITLLDARTGNVLSRINITPLFNQIGMLGFSPNSRFLAIESSETIYLYDVTADRVVKEFQNTLSSSRETKEMNMEIQKSIAFSPNGRLLLTSNWSVNGGQIVRLWDVATGKEVRQFRNQSAGLAAFSPDSRSLVTTGAGGPYDAKTAYLLDIASGKETRRFEGHSTAIISLAISPDGRLLLTGGADHTERLWDIGSGKELCRMLSLSNGNWVVTTSDGRFDTNDLENIKGLHWVLDDDPLKPLPLEIFMRQYYEPRLLARVLTGEKFKPLPKLGELNRTQPEVKIVDIKPDSAETVEITVQVASVKSAGQQDIFGNPVESGVYDVRLFRNGQLVGYTPTGDAGAKSTSFWSWLTGATKNNGQVELDADGKATLKFSKVKWPRTGAERVEFSAYAFNTDRVKSATDRKTYALAPKPAPVKGRVYVIRYGANWYEQEQLYLRYAANDARRMDNLAARLAALGKYEEVISLPLISDYAVTLEDGRPVTAQDASLRQAREGRKRVTENSATKAHLRAALGALAGRQADPAVLKQIPNADKLRAARPEDLVLISVSSHGYTDSDGVFYLVPSDSGTAPLASPEFRSRCVSSDELSRWLRDVDAGELVMIVDACHSAAAVEGTDFKPGPMGSRGLGQLSYDKGMRILTATQADNVALEANKVRQGLLIYALIEDGLQAWRADYKPKDKSILLTEWLGYGVERVPRLYGEVKGGRIRGTFDPRELEYGKTQQPALFDFARGRDMVLAHQPWR